MLTLGAWPKPDDKKRGSVHLWEGGVGVREAELTFGVSRVAELVLPHPHRPQHLQAVGSVLAINSSDCGRGLGCRHRCRRSRRRLAVGQGQRGRLDEGRVGGQVAVAHHGVRAGVHHLVGLGHSGLSRRVRGLPGQIEHHGGRLLGGRRGQLEVGRHERVLRGHRRLDGGRDPDDGRLGGDAVAVGRLQSVGVRQEAGLADRCRHGRRPGRAYRRQPGVSNGSDVSLQEVI